MEHMFRRLLSFAALICAIPVPLLGQSSSDALQSRLLNKPLFLRGFWQNDKLHFGPAGNLIGKSGTVSFTLSGIEVTKVELKSKALLLEGRRVGLKFDKYTPKLLALLAGTQNDSHEEDIRIEIDSPPDGDYTSALDAIFADDLASLVPSLPDEWQTFATRNLLPGSPPPSPKTEQPPAPPGTKRIGGGILPPRLLKSAEPGFDETARVMKIGGNCLISLVVGADGRPSQLRVLRPIGLGLDEQALRAVQQYVFAPATENGKAVAVMLNIEVNFAIF